MPWPLAAAVVGAAALDAGSSAFGAAQQRGWSAKEAEKDRAWQKEMSDTALYRRMADARRSGLNPILMATGGMGASSPGGSTARSGAVEGVDVGRATSSAAQLARFGQEQRLLKQQTYKARSEGSRANAQFQIASAEIPAATWRRRFYGSREGERLLKAEAYMGPISSAASAARQAAAIGGR